MRPSNVQKLRIDLRFFSLNKFGDNGLSVHCQVFCSKDFITVVFQFLFSTENCILCFPCIELTDNLEFVISVWSTYWVGPVNIIRCYCDSHFLHRCWLQRRPYLCLPHQFQVWGHCEILRMCDGHIVPSCPGRIQDHRLFVVIQPCFSSVFLFHRFVLRCLFAVLWLN